MQVHAGTQRLDRTSNLTELVYRSEVYREQVGTSRGNCGPTDGPQTLPARPGETLCVEESVEVIRQPVKLHEQPLIALPGGLEQRFHVRPHRLRQARAQLFGQGDEPFFTGMGNPVHGKQDVEI